MGDRTAFASLTTRMKGVHYLLPRFHEQSFPRQKNMPRTPAQKLLTLARQAAKKRRHDLRVFQRDTTAPDGGERWLSTCKFCDMECCVRPLPAPNQINIGGEAVALNCTRRF